MEKEYEIEGFKYGDIVVPVEGTNKPGESWEEGVFVGPFAEDVVSIDITKSVDGCKWASRKLCNIRKK